MRKLFFAACVATLGCTSINAQEFSFGVKAGVNFANVDGDFGIYDDLEGFEESKMRTGFHVGAVAEAKLSDKFAIQPELLFSNQGYKSEYKGDGVSAESDFSMNYIQLPIMAKFMPVSGLSIEVGPQFGFLISAKEKYDYTDEYYPEDNESGDEDAKDLFKTFDFGLGFGAGYKLENGVFFQARYNLGLSKVDEESQYDDIDFGIFDSTFSRKNRVIQVSVGFMF